MIAPREGTDFTEWLVGGERGISSNAIVSQLTGIPMDRSWAIGDHPHDPDDFSRCAKLLAMYPDAMPLFREKMPRRSSAWAALVAHWDEILTSLLAEVPDVLSGGRGSAPVTYRLMKSVIASAESTS